MTKMKKTAAFLLATAVWLTTLLTACDGIDDHYSANPTLRLSFSHDTLSFDTVFTTIGSATRQFMIYNKNDEPLNIESVLLASGGSTGFRINVDGRKGDSFEHIGILDKDSLYVFVEVTVDPHDSDQPLLLEDSILFSVNGIRQTVRLEAYGQDVHLYKGGVTVTEDKTLGANRPYLIYDSLVVAEGATLTIEKGALFYLHDKANIVVHGTLDVKGTLDAPVTFRGDRLDFILNDLLPYDRMPGQWGGIFFKGTSFDNRLDHAIIRNGTTGITCLPSTPERSKLTLTNSQVTNMEGNLFTAVNCKVFAANTELTNATGAVAALVGGEYRFVHCTLANYMSLRPRENSFPACLALSNVLPDKQAVPLDASFENCLIDGSYAEELLLSPDNGAAFDYRFHACVIKTEQESDAHYTNSFLVKTSPSYRLNGTKSDKYRFDFRLAEADDAGVGKADPAVSQAYPADRLGVKRLTSATGPTIGAYEFVPMQEGEE